MIAARTERVRRVDRDRGVVVIVLRLAGLWLLVTRVPSLLSQTAALWWSTAPNLSAPSWSLTDEPWLILNLVMFAFTLGAGLCLLLAARRIARLIVPLAEQACPGCDYALAGRPVEVCPECGLHLGHGFMDPPVDSTDGPNAR